jgi:hypothetical protein
MIRTLLCNAAAQVFVACLLGWWMLIPMQPWGAALRRKGSARALLAAHLDWILLALTQCLAAVIHQVFRLQHETLITAALVAGGWLNPVPYLLRAFGVDAFVFAGRWPQRLAAGVAGASALALTLAWGAICWQLLGPGRASLR